MKSGDARIALIGFPSVGKVQESHQADFVILNAIVLVVYFTQ
jgi:hypothetical protein